MAKSKGAKCKIKAVLRTNQDDMCIFCNRVVDDELIYGNFYTLHDISCHYFCVLLSSFAMQHGSDEQGLFGFLYSDIKEEAERGIKHKCSYCQKAGATLGCSVSQCRKQFHLPCGRERNAVSVFQGSYKSFCELHRPKQHIPAKIMDIAKSRKSLANKGVRANCEIAEQEIICVICCEPVPGYLSPVSFWPPCCAKDVWFHRLCIQRAALSAGVHYLKCPLCNDKEMFFKEAVSQGIYVPDRDASWELEQNAFNDMYERPNKCVADVCACPMGRTHTTDDGEWEVVVCLLCGAGATHAGCAGSSQASRYVCRACQDMAGEDLEQLADKLEAVRLKEMSSRQRARQRPVMPSRMSLRRTKLLALPSATSASQSPSTSSVTYTTSEELLEKRKMIPQKMFSPIKLLDDRIQSKLTNLDMAETEILVARLRESFIRPMPLTKKRKIVTNIIKELLPGVMSPISAEHIRDHLSPVKNHNLNGELNKKKIPKFNLDTGKKQDTKTKIDIKYDNAKITNEIIIPTQNVVKENELQDTNNEIININNDFEESSDIFLNKSITKNNKLKTVDMENIVKDMVHKENNQNNINEQCVENFNKSNTEEGKIKIIDMQGIVKEVTEQNTNTIKINNIEQKSDKNIHKCSENNKLKTIDIEHNSSIEISESDEAVRVDVIQVDETTNCDAIRDLLLQSIPDKCSLKFATYDEEILDNKNIDMDIELFKNQYLTEVDKTNFKCNFNHKHDNKNFIFKMNSVINFAVNASLQKDSKVDAANITDEEKISRKRKLAVEEDVPKKKHKSKHKKSKLLKIRLKTKKKKKLRREKRENKLEKPKTPVKVINESPKTLIQSVLNFSPENELKSPIKSPNNNQFKSPMKTHNKQIKRKGIINIIKDDHLKQTSLFNFFLVKQE